MADNSKDDILTVEGKKALEERLRYLEDVAKPQNVEDLRLARSQGDLSENADYDAARDHQARVEARIQELEAMIKNAVIVKDTEGASGELTVKFGATVKILDLSDNTEMEFQIVGSQEADPLNGKLSNATPMGESIMGAKVGDVVTIHHVEEPYEVKILEIRK